MGATVWWVLIIPSTIIHFHPKYLAGNLVYLHLFGQGFLYLNTYEDTVELLEKRGAVYADRPHSVMRSELNVDQQFFRRNACSFGFL